MEKVAYKYKVTRLDNSSCVITEDYPEFRKFYKDNTTVSAAKHTLGLMVFHRKKDAIAFVIKDEQLRGWKIKRVIPLSRGKTPRVIADWMSLINFYSHLDGIRLKRDTSRENWSYSPSVPPKGTICYHKLKVVGDCWKRGDK